MLRIYKNYFSQYDYPEKIATFEKGNYIFWTKHKHSYINYCKVKKIKLFGLITIYKG